jgi:hypothetical protein
VEGVQHERENGKVKERGGEGVAVGFDVFLGGGERGDRGDGEAEMLEELTHVKVDRRRKVSDGCGKVKPEHD